MCVFLLEFHYDDLVSFWKRLGEKIKIPGRTEARVGKADYERLTCKCALATLESGFQVLQVTKTESLMKKHLTREVFDRLKTRKTPTYGSNLLMVIKSGLMNPKSKVGLYAPDPEAYSVFADLFGPVIEEYHLGFNSTHFQPSSDLSLNIDLPPVDPRREFIISTRIRCSRNLEGYPFSPAMTKDDYIEIEVLVRAAVAKLKGDLKGKYRSLADISDRSQKELVEDHILFHYNDKYLQDANAFRFWPTGRGFFLNEEKNFMVWCNEEDHLRIISLDTGGDIGATYRRWVKAMLEMKKYLSFAKDKRLGYLSICPTNLGTGMRISVLIRLPELSHDMVLLKKLAKRYGLSIRGSHGEHSSRSEVPIFDISNSTRLGLTEVQYLKQVNYGVQQIISFERQLQNQK